MEFSERFFLKRMLKKDQLIKDLERNCVKLEKIVIFLSCIVCFESLTLLIIFILYIKGQL